jgi:hypothetical protein
MHERDFVSNHEEQQRIQDQSFQTNFWYEKRRDEFVVDDEVINKAGVSIVSNEILAFCYVAFWLQKPVHCIINRDMFFITKSESSSGLYEFIFNKDTTYKKMLSAYFVWQFALDIIAREDEDGDRYVSSPLADFVTPVFSLSKILLEKILFAKYGAEVNLCDYLNKSFSSFTLSEILKSDSDESEMVRNVIRFCMKFVFGKISKNGKDIEDEDNSEASKMFKKLMTDESYYEVLKHEMENKKLSEKQINTLVKSKKVVNKKAVRAKSKQ